MSSRHRIDVVAPNGDLYIPVSDSSFFSNQINTEYDALDVYFAFYDTADSSTPVNPTGGTIKVYGEYIDGFFLEANEPIVYAQHVSFPISKYIPCIIDGFCQRIRVDLDSVADANYMRSFAFSRRG